MVRQHGTRRRSDSSSQHERVHIRMDVFTISSYPPPPAQMAVRFSEGWMLSDARSSLFWAKVACCPVPDERTSYCEFFFFFFLDKSTAESVDDPREGPSRSGSLGERFRERFISTVDDGTRNSWWTNSRQCRQSWEEIMKYLPT